MPKVELRPFREIPDEKLKFAVVMARSHGGWLFARHRDRQTWDLPGGHREDGERIWETAERELFEETGAEASAIAPICAYTVGGGDARTCGALFFAEVSALKPLPQSEMAEVRYLEKMPDSLTYPDIQPILFQAGCEFALCWDYTMSDGF